MRFQSCHDYFRDPIEQTRQVVARQAGELSGRTGFPFAADSREVPKPGKNGRWASLL